MIGGFGIWELIIVLVILLLIFGPSRLGDIGSSLGKGIKGFRKSLKDDEPQDDQTSIQDKDAEPPSASSGKNGKSQ